MKILILAGGSGTRLWPLSRSHFPKQFLRLQDNETLLRKTIKRNLALTSPENIYILTHQDYFHEVLKEAKEIPKENILLEPAKKNTAPALALGLKFFEKKGISKQEILIVTPSDHVIAPEERYVHFMKQGEALAKKGSLVTFGVRPHRPETGYGYIQAKGEEVLEFVEKPDFATAQKYLIDGNYFWNSGMFAFSLQTIDEEMHLHAEKIMDTLQGTYEEALENFSNLVEISLDYAVMEKSKRVKMVALDLSWSDVGSWDQVYDILEKDGKGNAISGKVETIDTTNSLILSQKRLVSTLGLDNLLIIETEDALLVANKANGQMVKELVAKLHVHGRKEALEHVTVNRPWGSYTVLEEGERYKIKRIEVKPLEKLSLQLHYHRSEHWVVVKGAARVTIGDEEKMVHEGESIFVPKNAIHRVENPGKVLLEIIEVQVGEYVGEDDIVRLEDIYGRLKEEGSLKNPALKRQLQKLL